VNDTFALVSLTLPIINNTSSTDILGFMTVVADASSLYNVLTSREGLDTTGLILLVRPDNADNRFPAPHAPASPGHTVNVSALGTVAMDFVFKPTPIAGQDDRHSAYNKNGASFPLESYPAVRNSFATANPAINNATSDLSTSNEQGYNVAVGVARPQTTLVDWSLVVEQTHDEAWAPVIQLRNILLACVFGTAGFIALLVIPMAHFSVMPIRRLKDATKHSVMPHGLTPNGSIMSEHDDDDDEAPGDEENTRSVSQRSKRKGISVYLRRLRRGRTKSHAERSEDARRRVFKIPAKVQDRKHFVTDELTELTETFNEMTDELMGQYERLEEKVAERTRELELSKKAAEAANESKTLFIANISHELKTPLNGILGMCAVCMGEDDLDRIKRSLQVVYKSGDLLLHLLNDLLTFSKNQIGQSVTLEEKEFSLADIRSQISTIFDKQVREGRINFAVKFASFDGSDLSPDRITDIRAPELPAIGPSGTGRLKDMRLWGDQHRILQVIINLVSNSLKFTPEGGRVDVRIKCLGEAETSSDGSRTDSMGTTTGGKRGSRGRGRRVGSGSNNSVASAGHPGSSSNSKPPGTALQINPMSPTRAVNNIHTRERSPTPPPAGAKTLLFEFEVEDTGPGISPALQERVFEPFVQGDMGMSKKYGGTGLGLSICSQLAKLMGGDITLKSTVGIGSTFTMRIPLKFVKARAPSTASSDMSRPASVFTSDDKVLRRTSRDVSPIRTGLNQDPNPRLVGLSQPFFAAGPPSAPLSPGLRDPLDRSPSRRGPSDKIRVLVAEDNLVNQEVVLRMLKLEDIYNVTIAKDGQEAYDMVKTSMDRGEMYNLIFMDIQVCHQ
jgi:osomolarity two-component system sensor histidine kinase SLN1